MKSIARGFLLVSAATAPLIAPASGPAYAQTAARNYSIPAQDLGDALRQFGAQSGRDIVFDPALTAGKKSKPVAGAIDADRALQIMLEGSGLSYTTTSTGFAVRSAVGNVAADANSASSQGEGTAGDPDRAQDTEIVVTGTNIRGLRNPTAPVLIFDRQDIARTGYSNTEQFIRSLPQNFGGGANGPTEDGVLGGGSARQTNSSAATGINLRGLGTTGSLVLINGQRVAPAAFGEIVDVSVIPIDAIDRIDILTDGSSALYGSDAVGGVANFVLRRNYNGAETRVTAGTVTNGSFSDLTIGQTFGGSWGTGDGLASVQYRTRSNLSTSDRSFAFNGYSPADVIPELNQLSAIVHAGQHIGDSVQIQFGGIYSRKKIEPKYIYLFGNSPFASAFDNKSEFFSINAQGVVNLFSDWTMKAAFNRSGQSVKLVGQFDPDQFGYTDGTPYTNQDFDISEITAQADGSIVSLPGGNVRLAVGAGHRFEDFVSEIPWLSRTVNRTRKVDSIFGEIFAPITAPDRGGLSLSAAGRYDKYSDFGATFNHRLGIHLSPAPGLQLRAAHSTSFRAPTVGERGRALFPPVVVIIGFPDQSNTDVPTLLISGGKPLDPETSKSITLGVDWEPPAVPHLKFGIGYYWINYKNRIITPPTDFSALQRPDVYGSLITGFASDAEADAFIASLDPSQVIDIIGNGTAGVRFALDTRQLNAAILRQSGFDASVYYDWRMNRGRGYISVNATHINKIQTFLAKGASPVDLVNTVGNPLKFKARANLGWSSERWQVNAAVNFANRYRNNRVAPSESIKSFTTFDLNGRLALQHGLLAGSSFGLNLLNLFNAKPPRITSPFSSGADYDVGNADPLGRFISLDARLKW
jgi:outer membrane receptor protein involved in Fe transport